MLKTTSIFFLLLTCSVTMTGCASLFSEDPIPQAPVYSIASRQLAPEPTYNRIRQVRPPMPITARKQISRSSHYILPLEAVEIESTSLENASQQIAKQYGYRSYCASSIASQSVALKVVGSIDEASLQLAKQAGARVIIDHDARLIKFLPEEKKVVPRFFNNVNNKGLADEQHQQIDTGAALSG